MKVEFIELELDWHNELSVFELRNYILSKLNKYGEPLRWAITSLTTHTEEKIQKIFIEAVLIINEDKKQDINNRLD